MKKNRRDLLSNTKTNIERNYSFKDLLLSIIKGANKPGSLLVSGESELLQYISLEMNIRLLI